MSAAKAFSQRSAPITEGDFLDVFSLAAAESIIGVPFLGVTCGPRLAALRAIGTAEHVVGVRAVGAVMDLSRLLGWLAPAHALG